MQDVMLDFETLSTEDNALVVQIGACYFNPNTGELGSMYFAKIDPLDAQRNGAHISASTVLWWLQQSQSAQAAVFSQVATAERVAFIELNDFLRASSRIWSHPTFDFRILDQTLKRLKIGPSYSYRAPRDIRTIMDLYSGPLPAFEGVPHVAIDDCKHQVKCLAIAMKHIKGLHERKSKKAK